MKEAACIVSISPLRAEASDKSEIVSQLLFGDCVQIINITYPWAEVIVFDDNYRGFVDYKHLQPLSNKEYKRWVNGLDYVYEREITIQPQSGGIQYIPRGSRIPADVDTFNIGDLQFEVLEDNGEASNKIYDLALEYLNTPYLWGGKSPYGIDCSGLTQIVCRLCGFNLPRDANEQVDLGTEISFDDVEPGDLVFFINNTNHIHHVGIAGPNHTIIHASGHVRQDQFRPEGIYREDKEEFTHRLYRIIRL